MQVDKPVNGTLGIVGAILLSVEEAEQLSENLKKCNHWWWLRSPGYFQYIAAFVFSDGSVRDYGYDVNYDYFAVRPALAIELKDNWEIGDNFIFGDKEFEIISDNLAFCKTDIGQHRFDDHSNNYETSEIKRYVDDWFERAMAK